MTRRWGATPEEWTVFDLVLGLTDDLLPVVADPGVRISPDSKLKALGKTPSLYNRRGEAVGIPGWTQKRSTGREVESWSKVAGLGIALQTRWVRALDIDVDDAEAAGAIAGFVQAWLAAEGLDAAPVRGRAGSARQVLAFALDGTWGKRVVKVAGGMVEFLADGQQFVACGTHPGGARYEWVGGGPVGFPKPDAEGWERLWAGLVARFGTEPAVELRVAGRGEDLDLDDEVAAWLVENWETFGTDREGRRLFLACPWKAGHSMDSGETEAAWLLRGSGGVERGHFKCLHATCGARTREDFLKAAGWEETLFDDLAPAAAEPVSEGRVGSGPGEEAGGGIAEQGAVSGGNIAKLPLPGFARKRGGVIKATIGNAVRGCQHAEACGWHIRYDTFLDDLMIAPPGTQAWRPIADADPIRMRVDLESVGFEPIPPALIRDALILVGSERQFDSAVAWLESLPPWDGVERCTRFFTGYMPGADDDYGRALGRYVWSAHAGRIMSPGCQVDITPVLIGAQGIGKTRGVAAIAPAREFVCEIGFHEKDDDRARKMRGALVCEIAELRGLNTREAEEIKAFMSKRVESWIPKYREKKTTFGRRLVFWGTSNEDEILADASGERRWAPRRVTGDVDVEGIERDRDQLWAEGLETWRRSGVQWREAERLAAPEHEAHRIGDPWEERVWRWLQEPDLGGYRPGETEPLSLEVVAVGVLGLDFARFGKREEMRIGNILRHCGFERVLRRVEGAPKRVWVKNSANP